MGSDDEVRKAATDVVASHRRMRQSFGAEILTDTIMKLERALQGGTATAQEQCHTPDHGEPIGRYPNSNALHSRDLKSLTYEQADRVVECANAMARTPNPEKFPDVVKAWREYGVGAPVTWKPGWEKLTMALAALIDGNTETEWRARSLLGEE